jgi:hypothetical protein
MIEHVRPPEQRKSEVEEMAAAVGVHVFFIVQPQCPVRETQDPGAH